MPKGPSGQKRKASKYLPKIIFLGDDESPIEDGSYVLAEPTSLGKYKVNVAFAIGSTRGAVLVRRNIVGLDAAVDFSRSTAVERKIGFVYIRKGKFKPSSDPITRAVAIMREATGDATKSAKSKAR